MKNSLFIDMVNIVCEKIKKENEHSVYYSSAMVPEQKERFKKQVCACIDSL